MRGSKDDIVLKGKSSRDASASAIRAVARSVRRRKLKETPQETTFLPLFVRGARFGASKLASQDGALPTCPVREGELLFVASMDKKYPNSQWLQSQMSIGDMISFFLFAGLKEGLICRGRVAAAPWRRLR